MKNFSFIFKCFFVILLLTQFIMVIQASEPEVKKPDPEEVLTMLKEGNVRFYTGNATYPHVDAARLELAGKEDQGDYAYATVITCSDSFNGYGNGFYFIFEDINYDSNYCSTNLPTLLDGHVSAPDGPFNYDTGTVRINDFGTISLTPVPLPASLWLFLSSIPLLLHFKRKR